MSSIPWVIISIGVFIVLLGILTVLMLRRKKRMPTDYYSIFILGICLIPVGIPTGNYAISLLGLIYAIIGLKNRGKWKKNRFNWKKMKKDDRRIYVIMMGVLLFMLIAGVALFFFYAYKSDVQKNSSPSNFDECADAGYPIMETYPRQCKMPDGAIFIEGDQICVSPAGKAMSAFDAMRIAIKGECGNRLMDPYLEHSFCNENTGTWWIDLDLEKEGCSPACVVNIDTEESEINWRCTGLIS